MQFVKYIVLLLTFVVLTLTAQVPAGYYDNAEKKQDAALKTALFQTIRAHTQLEYYSLSTHFRTTDWHPGGYFWDMYSNNKRTSWSGLNREHCMPKSWFGVASGEENSVPIGSDIHNLFPSEPNANEAKSNYPLGEVGSNVSFSNGVVKVGYSGFGGYTGMVFEPADEYKGDFARTYMYVVTCYEDYSREWQSTGTESMLYQNTYPVFKAYAVNLLMKWHRADPVSEKEINRNNAAYSLQKNRNPYIDHPSLAEYIWGNNKGQVWDSSVSGSNTNELFFIHYKPLSKEVLVRLSPASGAPYRVVALNGQVVLSGNLSAMPTSSVSLKGLAYGTYLVLVDTEYNRFTGIFQVY